MKVYYARVSSKEQNESRQIDDLKETYDFVFIDKCSGSIPLFERPKGQQIQELINNKELTSLSVHSIDRLGRNTSDVLKTWQYLTEQKITIICNNPRLSNFNEDGSEDRVSEMIIAILSVMAKFENDMRRERQMEGIRIAKAKGKYKGRKVRTKEPDNKFLEKPKNKLIIRYLSSGYKYREICKILGTSTATITKVNEVYGKAMSKT